MKKFFVALIVASLFTSLAHAAPITFTDTTLFTTTGTTASEDLQSYGWGDVNKLDGTLDYVYWKHFFTFVPPAGEILNATLKIYLQDDERDTLNPFSWEFAFGASETGNWDFGDVDTDTYAYGLDISYLTDGAFGVKVASTWGDFYIGKSELEVSYEPVPEPSTVLLLGAGLAALGYFGRRRKMSGEA